MVHAQVSAPPQIHLANCYLPHLHFSQEESQPTKFSILNALQVMVLGSDLCISSCLTNHSNAPSKLI